MLRRLLLTTVLAVAGCAGSATPLPVSTSSFSPADTKTMEMVCTWRAGVVTVSAGLKPLIASFPLVADHAGFKASLRALRATDTLTNDPASHDPWMIALGRRYPRDEFMHLAKTLENDASSLSTVLDDLDAWATQDDLDPKSDLAAQLQAEISSLPPLMSNEFAARVCP